MKTWTYAANSYYKTASYVLEEAPWHSFFLEWFIQSICYIFSKFPIPFGSKIKIRDEEDGEVFTLKEYYGNMGGLFHMYVCDLITQFCYKKRKMKFIDTDYEQLKKERYKESPDLFEE